MILNGKPINPGELRTKITVLRRSFTTDAGGFQSQAAQLTQICEVWARWQNVHGQEAWTAATLQAEQAATALIRYRSGIDATCLVQKGSDLYQIVSLDNIHERGEYLELKVRRVVEG